MIIYEVCLKVEKQVQDDFQNWMHSHIKEVLECDGFISATWFEAQDLNSNDSSWVIHYSMKGENSFENYLKEHAPRLREKTIARFGGRFTTTRRLLKPILVIDPQ